jgi:hypothetical protein
VAGSQHAARFLVRWSVAVAVCLGVFAAVWWAWEALRLPPAGSDRLGVALAVAAVVSAASGGPLFWWAGRENADDSHGDTALRLRGGPPIGKVATSSAGQSEKLPGHAFISYVREDSPYVDQLQNSLEVAGIRVWRDTSDLWPGVEWKAKIRQAITDNALVFIACFSQQSLARSKSYQNEELVLAIEQLRLRRPDDPWLIPVRFDNCEIPDRDIGGGRTLASIQGVDLFGDRSGEAMTRLIETVLRILGRSAFPLGTTAGVRQTRHVPDRDQQRPSRPVDQGPDKRKDLPKRRVRWRSKPGATDKTSVNVRLRRAIAAFIILAGATIVLISSLLISSDGNAPGHASKYVVPGFSIDSPETVPWCNILQGKGEIPDGDSLLLFDSVSGSENQQPEFFYYDGTASQTSRDNWTVGPVFIGQQRDVGLKVRLDGVLVPEATARFVASALAYPPGRGAVFYDALPPALAGFHMIVTRNSGKSQCASV